MSNDNDFDKGLPGKKLNKETQTQNNPKKNLWEQKYLNQDATKKMLLLFVCPKPKQFTSPSVSL